MAATSSDTPTATRTMGPDDAGGSPGSSIAAGGVASLAARASVVELGTVVEGATAAVVSTGAAAVGAGLVGSAIALSAAMRRSICPTTWSISAGWRAPAITTSLWTIRFRPMTPTPQHWPFNDRPLSLTNLVTEPRAVLLASAGVAQLRTRQHRVRSGRAPDTGRRRDRGSRYGAGRSGLDVLLRLPRLP